MLVDRYIHIHNIAVFQRSAAERGYFQSKFPDRYSLVRDPVSHYVVRTGTTRHGESFI